MRYCVVFVLGMVLLFSYGCSVPTSPVSTQSRSQTLVLPTEHSTTVPLPTIPMSAVPPPTLTLVSPTLSPTTSTAPTLEREKYGSVGSLQRDVTYCTPEGTPLKLDLYFPLQPKSSPAPAVVIFHGNNEDRGRVAPLDELLTAGYVVVDADYRPVYSNKLPAPVSDARCAIRFLRANASALNIDSGSIGAYGCSFGSFLTGMLATASDQKQFDANHEFADQSSAIQAAAPISGVFDWKSYLEFPGKGEFVGYFFAADSTNDPILLQSSPITFVDKDDPPFFIVQGDRDTNVPPVQGDEMVEQLKNAGVSVESILVKGSDHCVRDQSGNDPARIEWVQRLIAFFDKNLK